MVLNPPWSTLPWAVPILSVPGPTPQVSARLGRQHKTIALWARQRVACLRRWLPEVELTVVSDQAYSVIELGHSCHRRGVRLIAPLQLDASLFEPALARPTGTVGRPRKVGARLPNMVTLLSDLATARETSTVRWCDGRERPLGLAMGTAWWYHPGFAPLPIRWVLSHGPEGKLEPRSWFSTDLGDAASVVVAEFVCRWPLEMSFKEARVHLGVETQRQWSDLAIACQTSCRVGLYSLVVSLGVELHHECPLAFRTASWYPKSQDTFSELLAAVRRHCWDGLDIRISRLDHFYVDILRPQLDRLLNAACYSH